MFVNTLKSFGIIITCLFNFSFLSFFLLQDRNIIGEAKKTQSERKSSSPTFSSRETALEIKFRFVFVVLRNTVFGGERKVMFMKSIEMERKGNKWKRRKGKYEERSRAGFLKACTLTTYLLASSFIFLYLYYWRKSFFTFFLIALKLIIGKKSKRFKTLLLSTEICTEFGRIVGFYR